MDLLTNVSYRQFFSGLTFGLIIGIGYEYIRGKFYSKKKRSSGCNGEENESSEFVSDDQGEYKLVLVIRTDLKMGKGKVAAQCSHAAVAAYQQASKRDPTALRQWSYGGQAKITVKVESEKEMLALQKKAQAKNLMTSLIRDAGRTQISPGSKTVLAIGPARRNLIDEITGDLKLY